MSNLYGRSVIKEADFTTDEWLSLITLAHQVKTERIHGRERPRLTGKVIALIFEKTSTRTRTAFEVAAFHQGAHVTMLDPSSSQLGHKESIADTAQVLSRFYDAIEYRGGVHRELETLAAYAHVPVYNGLTNDWHPTQMLADALTIREHLTSDFTKVTHAYIGDARFNTGRSILVSSAMLGMDVRIIAPEAYQPDLTAQKIAADFAEHTGARITITDDINAVRGADVISTDVWLSMGESHSAWAERIEALSPYQVNASLMARTDNPRTIFMHCLPAFHDLNTSVGRTIHAATGRSELEVTDEVFSSPASVVFDQAENRLHTIKAILIATLCDDLNIDASEV
ncbi:ornithine carbamoyltransferase [Trueperella sp. LYQ143]|uniref:ornithine carbamoyltransferase n=1 Tax=unclassified Trueperella TaxID=2630174 RepID=UPI0039832335